MSVSNAGVGDLRRVVDKRRSELGWSIQRLAAETGYGSQQALHGKLAGRVGFRPDELATIARVLDLDVIELIGCVWPDVARLDRLAGIRARLAGADRAEITEVESFLDSRKAPRSAPTRRSETG